ncbi:MAG: hypothetical protein JXM70_10820 [Pirellulales bacterium]|nr:hypothetical protein [Pirellulales bacterium]
MEFKKQYINRPALPLGAVMMLIFAIGFGQSSLAWAEDKPTISKLLLRPTAEPVPALKYQLLPSYIDCTPGNAALDYGRILVQWKSVEREKLLKKIEKWREMPLEKLPREEIRHMLDEQHWVFEGLTRASRRDTCEWQLPLRESSNPFEILLPELQQLRTLTYLLDVKARLEIAEGRFDDAVQTLQCGYGMARQIAEGPLLVYALVGMAVTDVMTKRVEELIAQPCSPNMYWALTMLPRPTVNIQKAIAMEINSFEMLFPELRDIETTPGTVRQWQGILDRMYEDRQIALWMPKAGKNINRIALMALVAVEYPHAKKVLIEGGLSSKTVEAMPVAQVVALDTVGQYKIIRDDLFKWFGLPYWQAREGLDAMDKQLRTARIRGVRNELVAMLLPALSSCKLAEARCERNVAILRTIEAVRMHASTNNGRSPSELNKISVVPLPIDPMTGKPFAYELKGDTATINAPAPPGVTGKNIHKKVEIQLLKTEDKRNMP